MISTRKIIRMAGKWQRKADLRRKKITFPGTDENGGTTTRPSSNRVAEKGHVVVYTVDQKRFSFPIAYLNNYIFRELFRMAEEEFGLPSEGPITISCEAEFMDYLMSLMQRRASAEIEKALLESISVCRVSSTYTESIQLPQLYCF